MKDTFFCLHKQGKFSESLEYLGNVLLMFPFIARVDEYVVDVSKGKSVQELSKGLIHKTLKNRRAVNKTIWHHQVFVVPSWRDESCFPFVSLSDSDQIICAPEI